MAKNLLNCKVKFISEILRFYFFVRKNKESSAFERIDVESFPSNFVRLIIRIVFVLNKGDCILRGTT